MRKLFLLLIVVIIFSSCAQSQDVQNCITGDVDGFWMGLVHGFISPLTFIISLFNDDVSVWSINNNGGWYSFGFLWGSGILTYSSTK